MDRQRKIRILEKLAASQPGAVPVPPPTPQPLDIGAVLQRNLGATFQGNQAGFQAGANVPLLGNATYSYSAGVPKPHNLAINTPLYGGNQYAPSLSLSNQIQPGSRYGISSALKAGYSAGPVDVAASWNPVDRSGTVNASTTQGGFTAQGGLSGSGQGLGGDASLSYRQNRWSAVGNVSGGQGRDTTVGVGGGYGAGPLAFQAGMQKSVGSAPTANAGLSYQRESRPADLVKNLSGNINYSRSMTGQDPGSLNINFGGTF